MKVADFIVSCESVVRIALYDGNNPICYTRSDWKGVEPYMGVEIDHFEIREDPTPNVSQVDIYLKLRGK
jgi:hypothetical protein